MPVEVIDQRTVGPSLGQDEIEASALAAIIGLALTPLFVVVVYRLVGLMAVLGLIGYAAMSYAALTHSEPRSPCLGLAGFVLAIGMAATAYVLVFERAREDDTSGRTDGLRRSAAQRLPERAVRDRRLEHHDPVGRRAALLPRGLDRSAASA